MSIGYKTRTGDLEIYNFCTKCGKFLKFDDCDLFMIGNDKIKAVGKCKRCGEVELAFEYF